MGVGGCSECFQTKSLFIHVLMGKGSWVFSHLKISYTCRVCEGDDLVDERLTVANW